MKYEEKTELIIKAFFNVYNTLGYGFLEKVYHNALLIELRNLGFNCESNKQILVYYQGHIVGEYYADIIVDDCIILELKADTSICKEHEYQIINYLKATKIEVGLLLNFGKHPDFKRKIFTNENKDFK
jgi:GxxExxY protein